MRYSEVDKNTLAGLKPQHIRMYLSSQGWERAYNDPKCDVFRKDNEEILVPTKQEFRDYIYRIEDLLETLSDFEHRTPTTIISSITFATAADVIEYKYSSPKDEYGVIPIEDMKSLLSAHIDITNFAFRDLTEWKPSYKSSRWEGSKITEEVKMGQTAAGSYLVRFMYPSFTESAVQSSIDGRLYPNDDTLMAICNKTLKSLNTLVDYAEEGKDTIDEKERISYNFINAVMSLEFRHSADLEVRRLPLHNRTKIVEKPAVMTNKIFPKISNIERNMKPPELKKEMEFVGLFIRIHDETSLNEERSPELIMQYFDEEKTSRVKLSLDGDALEKAYNAMQNGKVVKIKGTLVGSGRRKFIDEPHDLKVID